MKKIIFIIFIIAHASVFAIKKNLHITLSDPNLAGKVVFKVGDTVIKTVKIPKGKTVVVNDFPLNEVAEIWVVWDDGSTNEIGLFRLYEDRVKEIYVWPVAMDYFTIELIDGPPPLPPPSRKKFLAFLW